MATDLSADTQGLVRFGPFELDVRSRELKRGTRSIRLQDQPFEILRMMLERAGDVVTRDELRRRLWPDGTFVDFEHSLNAAIKRLRAALGDDAENPQFVQTLPRRGYRFIGTLATARHGGDPSALPRLAVLPFTNLADGGGQEYFTDGLTEEMIAQLGQRCGGRIGVVARWSSMVFKGSVDRAQEIGRALRADYLLEGSVRREADRVRITARLVDAQSETQLWADTYERHLVDCLSVQADVAARIAESLALELMPDAAAAAGATSVTSVSAYQEYLKGRYHWNNYLRPDDEGLEQALTHYREALRLDPRFAPAHAGAARVHIARAVNYRERPRTMLAAARAEAKQAIELDSGLAEGRLALADVRRMLEWDWRNAEAEYLAAISLNPSQENAHRGYGTMLAALGRYGGAVREVERACELDPLCLVVGTNAAFVQYLAGDYDAALHHCRRTTDIDPQFWSAQRVMGLVLLQTGRVADALALFEAGYEHAGHDPVFASALAHARALAGNVAGARQTLAAIDRIGRSRYVSWYHIAIALVGLADIDAAFNALEKAVVDCDPALVYLNVEPRFATVRSDLRYARLIDLLGLN